jgi:hypothetical protein
MTTKTDNLCTAHAYAVAREFGFNYAKINSTAALCFIATKLNGEGVVFGSDAAAARARKAVRRAAIALSK